jgi:ribose-phosphate pyrophosphokinase
MIILDGAEVEFGQFPNKETNLNINHIAFHSNSEITLKYENDADLFNLYILKSYIDECLDAHTNRVTLMVLYFPYSRMDRENGTYTFHLKYVAKMINDMKFHKVTVLDVHSDITPALVNRYTGFTNIPVLFSQFQNEHGMDNTFIFFPDAGAQKRYGSTYCYPTLVGFKSRNFSNGNIDSYQVLGNITEGADVVIIDDLCSKGGTFVQAATKLKELGAKDVYLIVGHCENTVFEGVIFDHIKKIYTTNSIIRDTTGGLNEQLSIKHLYTINGKRTHK